MVDDAGSRAYREQLGGRIAVAVGRFLNKSSAADAAGVTVEQLNKWIAGQVKVPADGLYRLAFSSEVDFSWLVTGEQPQKANRVRAKAPVVAVQVVGEVLLRIHRELGAKLPEGALVQEIARHLDAYLARMDDPSDEAEARALAPWLENRVRKEIKAAAAAPGTGKREAS